MCPATGSSRSDTEQGRNTFRSSPPSILGAFANPQKATVCFVMPKSAQKKKTLLQLGKFSGNFIFEYFSKIYRENSNCIKIWQEYPVFYMKTNIHFLIISRSFLLRMRNVSDKSRRENQNTHFMFNNFFLKKIASFMRWCGKIQTGHRRQYGARALHAG